ncbi:MAG: hypothetical protein KDJ76_12600 [Xanthobacteraceae bacterium]|nr:hypothetical protein [Xanthobacteraceae bacterium]
MTSELDAVQRQSLYDTEQSKIGKFSGLLSASCKFAWAGSLAIFFSSFVSADNAAFARLQSAYPILRMAALFGAICFVAEILQYFFAYLFASRYSKWLETAEVVTREDVASRTKSCWARSNIFLFYAKVACAVISACLLLLGTLAISLQRLPN